MHLPASIKNVVRRVLTKLLSDCGASPCQSFQTECGGGGDPSNYLNVKQLNIWKTKSLNDLKNFLHACVFMFGKRLERENKKSIKPFFLSFKIC